MERSSWAGRVTSGKLARAQALRGAPLLFAVLGDGVEHGGATLSFQQRVYQQRASARGPPRPCSLWTCPVLSLHSRLPLRGGRCPPWCQVVC